MNFAGRNLKYVNSTSEDLTPREKRLLAENSKLKRRNKRLSTAMLFLVDHVEARLPFLNGRTTAKPSPAEPEISSPRAAAKDKKPALAERVENRREVTPPPKAVSPSSAKPTPSKRDVKQSVVGTAWAPEKLEPSREAAANPKPPRPLSIQQVFAEEKKSREKNTDDGISIPDVPEEATPTVEPAPQEINAAGTAERQHAPELAPEERDILAAPTRDKREEGALASEEILKARKEEKKTAAEASMAYMAVSTVSRPIPEEISLSTDADSGDQTNIIDQVDAPSLAARAAQHNVMREAMLRRVNRLRW